MSSQVFVIQLHSDKIILDTSTEGTMTIDGNEPFLDVGKLKELLMVCSTADGVSIINLEGCVLNTDDDGEFVSITRLGDGE